MSDRYAIEWYREDQDPGHEWFLWAEHSDLDQAKRAIERTRDRLGGDNTFRLVRITDVREVLDENS